MNLNLFEDRKPEDNFINKFIEELKNALEDMTRKKQNSNEGNNVMDEYNSYEKKKIFLDNKTRRGNDLAWIMDEKSACISEHGDGGLIYISEINLPSDVEVGEVYEKMDGKYIYNQDLTNQLKEIIY